MLSSVQSCTGEVVLLHPDLSVIFRNCADGSFYHSKWCWEVHLGVQRAPRLVLVLVPSIFVQLFLFRAPQDEEFASKGVCFSMWLKKKKSTTETISLSLLIFYFFFVSEASVCWIGLSHLNVFSAYLIRSWKRVMKFTGLCSLDLKYKWAEHSFCFTPCQIRVLFWACFLFNFNELQLLRVTVKHTQVFLHNRGMQMIVERRNYIKKSTCPYAGTYTLQCFLWGYFFTIHLHKALFMMLIY